MASKEEGKKGKKPKKSQTSKGKKKKFTGLELCLKMPYRQLVWKSKDQYAQIRRTIDKWRIIRRGPVKDHPLVEGANRTKLDRMMKFNKSPTGIPSDIRSSFDASYTSIFGLVGLLRNANEHPAEGWKGPPFCGYPPDIFPSGYLDGSFTPECKTKSRIADGHGKRLPEDNKELYYCNVMHSRSDSWTALLTVGDDKGWRDYCNGHGTLAFLHKTLGHAKSKGNKEKETFNNIADNMAATEKLSLYEESEEPRETLHRYVTQNMRNKVTGHLYGRKTMHKRSKKLRTDLLHQVPIGLS